MKTILAITLLALAGCATPAQQSRYNNDPQYRAAYQQCDLESMKVSGSSSSDRAWNQGAYMAKCMQYKGYGR
jgi:uncharacterized lipoprotein YajG